MEDMKHTQPKPEGKKKTGTTVIIIVLLLALVGVGAYALLGNRQPEYDDHMEPNAVVGSMPGKSKEQLEAELTQQVKETEVAFSINAAPTFETGTAKGNILFENPSNNEKLTRVEIVIDETGELIYKSGLLEPGSYVPEAKLLVDLDAGSYTCTATIYAYRMEDESFIGKVAAGLTVTVEG